MAGITHLTLNIVVLVMYPYNDVCLSEGLIIHSLS